MMATVIEETQKQICMQEFWNLVFFFFYWHYNPLWVLAFSVIFFHSALSLHNFLHPLIPIIYISSSMSSIHLFLGFPLFPLPVGFHSGTLLGVPFPSIRITWPSQAILLHFTNLTISAFFINVTNFSYYVLLSVSWVCNELLFNTRVWKVTPRKQKFFRLAQRWIIFGKNVKCALEYLLSYIQDNSTSTYGNTLVFLMGVKFGVGNWREKDKLIAFEEMMMNRIRI